MRRRKNRLHSRLQGRRLHPNDMPDTQETEYKAHPLRRFIIGVTAIVTALFLLCYLVLLSGLIDRVVIPLASSRMLGARLDLRIDSLNPLRMRNIQLQQGDSVPLLRSDSITVHFMREPAGIMPIFASIDINNPLLYFDAREPAHSNYRFLQPYFSGGTSDSSSSLQFPRNVTINNIGLHVDMPDWSAAISNLSLYSKSDAANQITARLSGDAVLAGWQTGHDWLNVDMPRGAIDADIMVSRENADVKANILLPEFLIVNGHAAIIRQPFLQMDVMIDDMQLDAPIFGQILSGFTPVSVGYDSVRIAPLQLKMSMEDNILRIKGAECSIRAEKLLLGAPDVPWYSGNLGITLHGGYGDGSQAAWTATLNQGQQVSGTISTEEDEIRIEAMIKNWTDKDWIPLWPEPYATLKTWLPNLGNSNGEVKFTYKQQHMNFAAAVSTGLPSGTGATITSSGVYSADKAITIRGEGLIGKGSCFLEVGTQEKLTAKVSVDSIAASDLFSCLPWDALKVINGNLAGEATVSIEENGSYTFQSNVKADSLIYDNWKLPEALGMPSLNCRGSLTPDLSTATAAGTVQLADAASVKTDSFIYDIETNRMMSDFEGTVALTAVAGSLGFNDLWGDVAAAGTFNLTDWKQLTISPLRLTSDSLGYGDYSLPYGEELVFESPVRLDMTDLSISAGPSRVAVGDGTTITADVIHVNADHAIASPTISVETDFALLVAKQFLDAADGRLKLNVEDFLYERDTVAGKVLYDCNAAHLVLPGKLADIRGLTASGSAVLPPDPENKGILQIEELKVGGSTIKQTSGSILLGEQGIILEDVKFSLFGGGVAAHASVNIFGTAFSVSVSGEVNNLDLSVFTSEFEPPSLILTGRVNGTFKAGFDMQQLTELDVDLSATDEFSINRDMVEQLLLSQYVDEMTGGKQMTRVLKSVIGDNTQRIFDSARMVLGLENGRITGYAKLESEKLNLTVDIKADPEALLEALKTRQE